MLGADDRRVEGGTGGEGKGRENNNGGAAPAAGKGQESYTGEPMGRAIFWKTISSRQNIGKTIYFAHCCTGKYILSGAEISKIWANNIVGLAQ